MQSRPSRLLRVKNSLAAYLFDGAVITFGSIVESALHERIEVGSGDSKKFVDKYTLKQLLEPSFKLPREDRQAQSANINMLKGVAGAFVDEVS